MGAAEERMEILKMIQDGQITPEEGARLLEAVEEHPGRDEGRKRGKEPHRLQILVTDLATGQEKVKLQMPWGLVKVGVSMGARFAHEEIDLQDFIAAVQEGAEGKIVDVVDEEDNERVEIFVE